MAERQLSLTRAFAAKIVEAVAKDEACKRLIPKSYFMGGAGYAGSIRNIVNEPGLFVNPWHMPSAKSSDEACTGIASATAAAINAAAKKDSTFPVAKAESVDRQSGMLGVHHTATKVTLQNGDAYVFDWHASLAIRNPMIYHSVQVWKQDMDGVLFKDWTGMMYTRVTAVAQ